MGSNMSKSRIFDVAALDTHGGHSALHTKHSTLYPTSKPRASTPEPQSSSAPAGPSPSAFGRAASAPEPSTPRPPSPNDRWATPRTASSSSTPKHSRVPSADKPAASAAESRAESSTAPLPGALQGFRAEILHFLEEPLKGGSKAHQHFEDGLLVTRNGKVVACGPAESLIGQFEGIQIVDCRPNLIIPGFCDSHIHFPQIDMIASYGEQLLEWLQKYTFPAEAKYKHKEYAKQAAKEFVAELLRNGTTTALTFCTVHEESVDALFEEAESMDMLMIAGKVLMDAEPFAPPELRMDAQESYEASKRLINKWHQRGRNLYAVTPRFAITSSPEELELAGRLLKEHEGLYVHTHMNENKDEIALAKKLHAPAENYLEIYDRAGLLGSKTVLAHCIHMEDRELKKMHDTKSVCSFCPTSNLFLGSGLFDIKRFRQHEVRHGLGTDVGAGTSYCQLQTLNEAYKVCQLQGVALDPLQSFYMATLGTAASLSVDHRIGNFEVGKEADFLVLDMASTPLIKKRIAQCQNIEDKLFVLETLGDDRSILATFIKAVCRYKKEA